MDPAMSIVQAILLGLLQGLTEFLPVSSSGHLIVAREVMEIGEIPSLFDIILHLATLIVVVWIFRIRIGALSGAAWRFLRKGTQPQDRAQQRFIVRLLEASAVTAVIGFAISRFDMRENPTRVAMMFIATALILLSTLFFRVRNNTTGRLHSLIIGGAQGLGVIPGISRAGITISSGLILGFDRKEAGEFSFLLSIPAIIGAMLMNLNDARILLKAVPLPAIVAGFLAALFVGYACLRFLLWIISDGKLWVFAIYLIPAGIWTFVRFAPNY